MGISSLHRWIFGLSILLHLFSLVSGQTNNATCLSLQGSKLCPSFAAASISTGLTTDFPFLQYVSNIQQFDSLFMSYIEQDYAKYHSSRQSLMPREKYVNLFQCEGINLSNTSFYYAQFTQTVLCAQMVQESIQPCGLTTAEA